MEYLIPQVQMEDRYGITQIVVIKQAKQEIVKMQIMKVQQVHTIVEMDQKRVQQEQYMECMIWQEVYGSM